MKSKRIHNCLAATAAALGSLGAAQADIIPEITVNITGTNTTPVTDVGAGVTYPAPATGTLNLFNVDTVKQIGMCDATILEATGPVTTPQEPFTFALSGIGATNGTISALNNASPYSMQWFVSALASDIGTGYTLDRSTASWQELFNYVNANSPYTQYGSLVYTTDNS